MPSLAQRWIDQGMQQGMQKGMQKGMQQGMQKGMLQEAREMVLDALETRFRDYPAHMREQILQMTDREKLKEILRLILRIQSIEELEKARVWN